MAGVGNIFCGDDGFGVEVVRQLAERTWPEGVRVVDFGIRGLDLAYALLDGYDAVVIVDAIRRGEPPGTVHVLEPDRAEIESGPVAMETHDLNPVAVLRLVHAMGGHIPRLWVVGCEPATLGSDDAILAGLSEPVRASVDETVRMVEALVAAVRRSG
jgi:hydrogenase maturation protease